MPSQTKNLNRLPFSQKSKLTDLIAKAKAIDAQLGADLEREFQALSSRLSFGLNFERHRPEAVELPQRRVRRGDKVHTMDLTSADVRQAVMEAKNAEALYKSTEAYDYS